MSLNNLELILNKEDASNNEEQIVNNEKQIVNNQEQIVNNQEQIVNNQEKISSKITTLCFSGGGIKGFSFLGALEGLIEKKIINLSEIRCFVGTSIGAMLSFLLILGWEIEEMKEITRKHLVEYNHG